jgi:hypothetical protein
MIAELIRVPPVYSAGVSGTPKKEQCPDGR